ncbi:MAG TPA: segregation/condensation protein A [Anaerolineaceae bacterium]|jgi:segregation and condensation protein A|nr:segregation/condensation protein A [Anaerolineaceae bacterium]
MGKLWHRASDNYEIETELYSGPLDLLLDLIQKAELDITKLALAKVTDQFLAYVTLHKDVDPDFSSEFLVIASKLVQIKSEAMLPRPPIRMEDEEDVGETLARQLIVYREIKKASQWLSERFDQGQRCYLHLAQSYPVNVQLDLSNIEIADLIKALEQIAIQEQSIQDGATISIPRLTLRKKVQEIIQILRQDSQIRFSNLLGEQASRLDSIVLFLAILELVKQEMISTEQEGLFSDITLQANDKLYHVIENEVQIEEL